MTATYTHGVFSSLDGVGAASTNGQARPVITGQTEVSPIFEGAADFDLELVEHWTLDGHIQELIYRPPHH